MGVTVTLSRARPEQLGSDPARRWLYDFAEGSREQRELLGGKDANLAELTRVLGQEQVRIATVAAAQAAIADR